MRKRKTKQKQTNKQTNKTKQKQNKKKHGHKSSHQEKHSCKAKKKQKKLSTFPVARAHCILTTKFARSNLFNEVCIQKSLKFRKTCYKIIFRPEQAVDISSVYLLNQIFESVSDLLAKEISKRIGPKYCVCISSFSVDKMNVHCCFSIDKIQNNDPHCT